MVLTMVMISIMLMLEPHRNWNDCKKYGFMAAGGGKKYSEQISRLKAGDILTAYLTIDRKDRSARNGFVGIGIVQEEAVPVSKFLYNGRPLKHWPLTQPAIFKEKDPQKAEHLVKVNWKKAVDRNQAKWTKNAGLFTPHGKVVSSLKDQDKTIDFLQKEFKIRFSDLIP